MGCIERIDLTQDRDEGQAPGNVLLMNLWVP
jgi:hypothetical protein